MPHTAPHTPPQIVTIAEAARILGIHRRTVERRIKCGEIATTTAAGRRIVVLGGEPLPGDAPQSDAAGARAAADTAALGAAVDAALVPELRARVADLETDRDQWRQTAADLSRNLTEVTGTLYALRDGARALPGTGPEDARPDDAPQRPPQRPWWRFWRRL